MKPDTLFHIDAIDVQQVAFSHANKTYKFSVLRLDKVSLEASGNKFFKLKYNVFSAIQRESNTILTFGGAWSNHIQATASICKKLNIRSIGIIRGEEPKNWSNTLLKAKENGMELRFISRDEYREKNEDFFKAWLRDEYGHFQLVPEGGSNFLGVQGCMEIPHFIPENSENIFLAAGTGATAAGILLGSSKKVHVNSALKGGEFLKNDISSQIYWSVVSQELTDEVMTRMELMTDFHYGGYAKFTPELLKLIRDFHSQTAIKLEPVYTGKTLAALLSAIDSEKVKNDYSTLLIHTGGLQGIKGIEQRIGEKLF